MVPMEKAWRSAVLAKSPRGFEPFKRHGIKFWLTFLERFGGPTAIVIAKISPKHFTRRQDGARDGTGFT